MTFEIDPSAFFIGMAIGFLIVLFLCRLADKRG